MPTMINAKKLLSTLYTLRLHAQRLIDETESRQKKKEKKTIPEAGSNKYLVILYPFTCYTVIGADNIHHAYNKATKLWGPYWSRVADAAHQFNIDKFATFVSVKEFGARIKTLSQQDSQNL